MKYVNVRKLTVTAIMGAVASVLMYLSFSTPVIPSFIKLDFSELPALIAAFSMGPVSGGAVCLIKNVVSVLSTSTAGVGELSNFLLGLFFVVPAGILYRRMNSRKGALIASLVGAAAMAWTWPAFMAHCCSRRCCGSMCPSRSLRACATWPSPLPSISGCRPSSRERRAERLGC